MQIELKCDIIDFDQKVREQERERNRQRCRRSEGDKRVSQPTKAQRRKAGRQGERARETRASNLWRQAPAKERSLRCTAKGSE